MRRRRSARKFVNVNARVSLPMTTRSTERHPRWPRIVATEMAAARRSRLRTASYVSERAELRGERAGPLMAAAHPDAFTLAHHPRLRRASGAHRIDGVGKPLALALHALPAGNLTFAGGIERSAANLDLTLSLVMADDQAIWRDAGPSQPERMRRRAVGEQLFAAAKHDRHCEDAHSVDQVIGEQRVDEFGTALGDEVRAVFLLQALHVGDVAQEH